ncbi:hypothetical protein ACWF94_03820 [Streptomyces sp. NPDC055078]
MFRRTSHTVQAVRADATRAASGQHTTPKDNQAAAERRALMREASNHERRQHAHERVRMSDHSPGAPDPG